MSLAIDYLPETYRARVGRTRARRERLILLIPLLCALVVTDWILRQRVQVTRQVAGQAEAHATQGEQRAEQTRQLAQRVVAARREVETWVAPLAAPRMAELLDDLLADRPSDLLVQELACRHEPWSVDASPTIRLVASCASPAAFTAYTAALHTAAALPRLTCQRTFSTDDDQRFGFHLESTSTPAVIR